VSAGSGMLDSSCRSRETQRVLRAGTSQKRIARTLKMAYADGLLSADTFARRVDQLHAAPLVDPGRLVGDLNLRASRPDRSFTQALGAALRRVIGSSEHPPVDSVVLLALDWAGGRTELIVGRDQTCDVMLPDPSVSRRHARLLFRDGSWVLQDLGSTNGTVVNDVRVGRCELRPGDLMILGDTRLRID
jgi:hypothetical protein